MHFWSFLAKYCHFWPISSHAQPKKQCKQGAKVFFSVMLVPKLLLSPVKKWGIFAKNDQILPEIDIFGHIGPGLEGSFGALLVGW